MKPIIKVDFFHNSGSFEGWRQIRFHPVFNTLIIKNFLSIFASVWNSQSWEHGRKYSSDNSLNWRLIQYTKKSQVFLLKKKCCLLNFMTQISIRNWTKENLFILARRRRDLGSKLLQKILLDVCYARGAPCISCALFKASYPAHTEQNVMWPPVSCQLIGRLQGRIVVCLLFEYLPTLPIIKVSCNKLTSCAVFTEK